MNYGYFVEGKPFGLKYAQARARAQHLANEYGRLVSLSFKYPTGVVETSWTAVPQINKQVAA